MENPQLGTFKRIFFAHEKGEQYLRKIKFHGIQFFQPQGNLALNNQVDYPVEEERATVTQEL